MRSRSLPSFPFQGQVLSLSLDRVAHLALAVCFSHATRHSESCCDGGEDGDNHVDDHLPGFFLVFCGHNTVKS